MKTGKDVRIIAGQVTMTIKEFANPSSDAKSISILEEIEKELGYHHGEFTVNYAKILAYTLAMTFNWDEDTLYFQRNLETWWEMTQSGNYSQAESYIWIMENVENEIHNSLQAAIIEAHIKPKPRREKLISLAGEAAKDPNS